MKFLVSVLLCWLPLVAAGEVQKIGRPKTEKGFVTVYYPDGFDAGKRYSVLYWFHGTGGSPNAGIGRGHDRFISVGMSYLKRDEVPAGGYGAAHWEECLAVRAELEKHGLKLDRNVVAGMSKGGWASFYIAAQPRDGLHAVGIFAAGKDPNVKKVPSLKGRGLSVLVGTGETDPNYPQAQLAVDVLKAAGAVVFYEEWTGEGHTYHRDGRVRDWLDVEARRSDPAELRSYCARAVEEALAKAQAWKNPKDRYVAMRLLVGDPRLRAAGEAWQKRVKQAGSELAQDPGVKGWLGAFNRSRELLRREVAFFDRRDFKLPQLEKLVAAYDKLMAEVGHADLAARAAYGHHRAAKMLAIYTEQKKAQEDPAYRRLMEEYVKLQAKFGQANGKPGEPVMARLKEVGARLGELRHKASMGAFREAEWGDGSGAKDPLVKAVIQAGKLATRGKPVAFSGVAF